MFYLQERLLAFEKGMKERLYQATRNVTSRNNAYASLTPWWTSDRTPANVSISAYSYSYFESIQALNPEMQTVVFSYRLKRLSEILVRDYFTITSNDCDLMVGTQDVHIHRCSSDLDKNFSRPTPLTLRALAVALPYRFLHSSLKSSGTVPLYYIHVARYVFVYEDGDAVFGNFKIAIIRCDHGIGMAPTTDINRVRAAPLYQQVFTIAQAKGKGFYHSVLENLCRLAPYVDFLKENPQIKIHSKIVSPFLSLLGLDPGRVVTGDIRANLLYLPAGVPCCVSPPFCTQTLSRQLRKGVEGQPRDQIILIQRSTRRWFRNHDAILKRLKRLASPHGLGVQVFGDNPLPGLQATKTMFARAVLVVAPHGAGETNLVFSAPGTVLVEGLCFVRGGNFTSKCYQTMAYSLGQRYHGLVFAKDCFDISPNDIGGPVEKILKLI